jgi:hypothetical protein
MEQRKTRGTSAVVKYLGIAICAVGLTALTALQAAAVPLSFGSNAYELILVADPYNGMNNSWDTASAAAAASVYKGVHGHLATVTSQQENDFLVSLIPVVFTEFTGAWLGGKSPEGWLVGPEAGQPFTYTNWGGIEPNNEGYAYMNLGTTPFLVPGLWMDDSNVQGVPEPGGDPVIGYFVEYESVPEPATWLLLAAGLSCLALIQRKRTYTNG